MVRVQYGDGGVAAFAAPRVTPVEVASYALGTALAKLPPPNLPGLQLAAVNAGAYGLTMNVAALEGASLTLGAQSLSVAMASASVGGLVAVGAMKGGGEVENAEAKPREAGRPASERGSPLPERIAGTRGLEHSFDRHAAQWFGREVSATTHLRKWQALIERAATRKHKVPWSTRGLPTVGHLAQIDGKYFFVQFFSEGERAGELATKEPGQRVYRRFVEVADLIPCVYGAILIEYTLEEPSDLLLDGRSLAFMDFFLSRERVPAPAINAALQLAGPGAYTESTRTGVYVSLTPEFNPLGRGTDPLDAQKRSVRIATALSCSL